MTGTRKKLFENQSVGLSVDVTDRRLKSAGIVLSADLALTRKRTGPKSNYRLNVTRKLARV